MNFESYLQHFSAILEQTHISSPYEDPEYVHHVKMNQTRLKRWLKTAEITAETKNAIAAIHSKQKWIVITEPWCGDAAHSIPIIHLMAELNPLIEVDYQLRDTAPFLIDNYLTNGGKSIPILVIRDDNDKDIAVWGPRPAASQQLFSSLKEQQVSFDEIKTQLQKWYNDDQSLSIQNEILSLLK